MTVFYKETTTHITLFNKLEDTESGFWASRLKYNKLNNTVIVKEKVFISNKDYDAFKKRYKPTQDSEFLIAKLLLLSK